MSKRITKILGLILTIMLMASIFVPAAPASAAYGEQQFSVQPLPSANSYVLLRGSDVADIAVGAGVIYATDNGSATGNVYKSTDGGASWTKTIAPAAVALRKISVAPDNANVIAVTDGVSVYSSTDSGASWANLTSGGLPAPWTGMTIMDLSVAPARSGTLLGREYVIAVANPTTSQTGGGDVLIIGNTNTWTSALPAGQTGLRDYVAVQVTPNFVGDRSVVALGAGAAAYAGVVVQVINTNGNLLISTANLSATTADFGAGASDIVGGSIALPSDFDATTSSGRRAYVGFAANTGVGDNDVYRVDDNAGRALGAVTSVGVWSVAFTGTVASGTLFEGRMNTAEVKYSTDMTSNSPTWTTTKKLMPTASVSTLVVTAADFTTSKTVYVGTSGFDSGFSVSKDGGISFDQKSLIDLNYLANDVNLITSGPALSPDGKTLFMATSANASGATGPVEISVWKSSTPTTDTSWSRIFVTAGTSGAPYLMPDYATTSTLLVFDVGAAVGSTSIYRSTDGGATWNTRIPPSVITKYIFQDANIGWISDASYNIYKTTNGAWTWSTAVTANVGAIRQLASTKTDELVVGGLGKIAISKDGGSTFTVYDGADSNDSYLVAKDTAYATNNILWVADAGANTNKAYRWQVGVDAKPLDLLNSQTSSTIASIGIRAGVLYLFKTATGVINRAANPLDTPSQITWDNLDTPALGAVSAGTSCTDTGSSIVYMRRGTAPAVWAYTDQMATAKATFVSPSTNSTANVDPNTGYGQTFNAVIQAMGTGQGLVDTFDVEIADVTVGWSGAYRGVGITVSSPSAPQFTIPNTQLTTAGFPGLETTKTYQYRVRAADQLSNDAIHSPWSDARQVAVAPGGKVQQTQYGPLLLGPQGGATGVSTMPGFAWAPVSGASEYTFKLATDAALTKTVAGTPKVVTQPSFQVTTALSPNTLYFWAVQVTNPGLGPVSIGTFTTAAPPAPVTAAPVPTITMPPITIPPIVIPPQPAPTITIPPAPPAPAPITPAFIWAILIVGAVLVIAVIVLIIRTRRVP